MLSTFQLMRTYLTFSLLKDIIFYRQSFLHHLKYSVPWIWYQHMCMKTYAHVYTAYMHTYIQIIHMHTHNTLAHKQYIYPHNTHAYLQYTFKQNIYACIVYIYHITWKNTWIYNIFAQYLSTQTIYMHTWNTYSYAIIFVYTHVYIYNAHPYSQYPCSLSVYILTKYPHIHIYSYIHTLTSVDPCTHK